jgi:hypothetical protein
MIAKVPSVVSDDFYIVDTSLGHDDVIQLVEKNNQYFFQKINGRKREHFAVYKGCLIASYTASGTGWTQRFHIPYLVCSKTGQLKCLYAGCTSMYLAKKAIDTAIAQGIQE